VSGRRPGIVKSRMIRNVGHVHMHTKWEILTKSGFRVVRMKRCRCKLEESIEMEFRKEGFECVNWIKVTCFVKQGYQGLVLGGWWWWWWGCFDNQLGNTGTVKTTKFRKIAVFWEVKLLAVLSHYQCFRGICCLFHQGRE